MPGYKAECVALVFVVHQSIGDAYKILKFKDDVKKSAEKVESYQETYNTTVRQYIIFL